MKNSLLALILIFGITLNSFAQESETYYEEITGRGTANGGEFDYEATLEAKLYNSGLGGIALKIGIKEYKITSFTYKEELYHTIDKGFPIEINNIQSDLVDGYLNIKSATGHYSVATQNFSLLGVRKGHLDNVELTKENIKSIKDYNNGDPVSFIDFYLEFSGQLKNTYFEELSKIASSYNQKKLKEQQDNYLAEEKEKSQEKLKEIEIEQERDRKAQEREALKPENYYKTSPNAINTGGYPATSYQNAQQQIEEVNTQYDQLGNQLTTTLNTISTSIIKDQERIEANKRKEAEERKRIEEKRISSEKEKVHRDKFMDSYTATIAEIVEDGQSIFNIITPKADYSDISKLTIKSLEKTFELNPKLSNLKVFYLTFVKITANNEDFSFGYKDKYNGIITFDSNIEPRALLEYSAPIKLPINILQRDKDIKLFDIYLIQNKYYNPNWKDVKEGVEADFLYFSTTENGFQNLVDERSSVYADINIHFKKNNINNSLYNKIEEEYQNELQKGEIIKNDAEEGDADQMLLLANSYFTGKGKPKDFPKAEYWYKKAAEQGNVDAMFNLGNLYSFDFGMNPEIGGQLYGVKNDNVKAFYWFEQAANKGHLEAMETLGEWFYRGQGCTQDFSKSEYWFKKATEKGSVKAMYELGYRYMYIGEYDKAITYWEKSAEKGDKNSMIRVGNIYYDGGIIRWYGKTSNQPKIGKGKYRDYKKAEYWYQKVCDAGYGCNYLENLKN